MMDWIVCRVARGSTDLPCRVLHWCLQRAFVCLVVSHLVLPAKGVRGLRVVGRLLDAPAMLGTFSRSLVVARFVLLPAVWSVLWCVCQDYVTRYELFLLCGHTGKNAILAITI